MILFGRSCRYWNYGSSMVKNLPEMQETCILSLGHEDTLEEEMAIHSNILAWKEPGGLQYMGSQKGKHD